MRFEYKRNVQKGVAMKKRTWISSLKLSVGRPTDLMLPSLALEEISGLSASMRRAQYSLR